MIVEIDHEQPLEWMIERVELPQQDARVAHWIDDQRELRNDGWEITVLSEELPADGGRRQMVALIAVGYRL